MCRRRDESLTITFYVCVCVYIYNSRAGGQWIRAALVTSGYARVRVFRDDNEHVLSRNWLWWLCESCRDGGCPPSVSLRRAALYSADKYPILIRPTGRLVRVPVAEIVFCVDAPSSDNGRFVRRENVVVQTTTKLRGRKTVRVSSFGPIGIPGDVRALLWPSFARTTETEKPIMVGTWIRRKRRGTNINWTTLTYAYGAAIFVRFYGRCKGLRVAIQ